jgi:hypothetical protein
MTLIKYLLLVCKFDLFLATFIPLFSLLRHPNVNDCLLDHHLIRRTYLSDLNLWAVFWDLWDRRVHSILFVVEKVVLFRRWATGGIFTISINPLDELSWIAETGTIWLATDGNVIGHNWRIMMFDACMDLAPCILLVLVVKTLTLPDIKLIWRWWSYPHLVITVMVLMWHSYELALVISTYWSS